MRLLFVTVLLVLPAAVWADEQARKWLDKMSRAVQSLNYEGTFVFMHDDRVETMRLVHGFDGEHIRERLVSLTGEAREVIRDQNVLTCVWPKSKYVVVETSRSRSGIPASIPTDIDEVANYYEFALQGKERIAGLDCQLISIQPKDEYRYGYRFCVAEKSGLLLKSSLLNSSGKPIEQVMFTSVQQHDDIPAERFESQYRDESYTWHTAASQGEQPTLEADSSWRISNMPPGFKITNNSKRHIAANPQPVQHMIMTDGLASVSVFIAKPETRDELYRGVTHRGALNAYARDLNGYQVTVVGEVPQNTLDMIGQSVVHEK